MRQVGFAIDVLPRVVGIIIVDLSTWFNHEQKKTTPTPAITASMKKNTSMTSLPKCLRERMIYATIDCTDDGENGFPRSLNLKWPFWRLCLCPAKSRFPLRARDLSTYEARISIFAMGGRPVRTRPVRFELDHPQGPDREGPSQQDLLCLF